MSNRRAFLKTSVLSGFAFGAAGSFAGIMEGYAAKAKVQGNKPVETFTPWQEGWLDIHQIATGRGNAAFIICPDGTTLLIDAGDLGETQRPLSTIMPRLPNAGKFAGEWMVDYIRRFSEPLKQNVLSLDYVFLTHLHSDHIGCAQSIAPKSEKGGYLLSGISQVAEYVQTGKIVDRGWPAYDYPSREHAKDANKSFFEDYLKFLNYRQQKQHTRIEKFEPGSRSQFTLRNRPDKYPDFEIRNVYANGVLWTGEGTRTRTIFPEIASLKPEDYPSENMCSSAIKISYGAFRYFSGGDIPGLVKEDVPSWRDVEAAVGKVVGAVDVAVANHHAFSDAQTAPFLAATQPRVVIVPVWDFYHPQPEVLERMMDKSIYPGERLIFATGLLEENRKRLGEAAKAILPTGHIVTRVYEGGKRFGIFVIDAESETFEVKYATEQYVSGLG
jgi:beta-lactamase superfamily II metal-dependent hydrolase